MVSQSLFLILHTDMWVKLASVQGAFAQTAKMNVFLQHDMKNIVQLVNLLGEQLESGRPGSEEKLMQSVRGVMPTLRQRCERFLKTLSSEPSPETRSEIDLCEAFHKTAKIHDLQVSIEGGAAVDMNQESLDSIFDNLFGNYVDQSQLNTGQRPDIAVRIEGQGDKLVKIEVQDRNGGPCKWPERLFEPFWSEKGDGLGIGLYHARQLVTAAGGTIEARAEPDKPLIFVMKLPK